MLRLAALAAGAGVVAGPAAAADAAVARHTGSTSPASIRRIQDLVAAGTTAHYFSSRLPHNDEWRGFSGDGGSGINGAGNARYSNTVGKGLEWDVWLDAGTYYVDIDGVSGSDHGIASLKLDGTQFGTYDFYAASGATFFAWDAASFTVTSTGLHTLRFEVTNKKNASSSGVYLQLANLWLRGPQIGVVYLGGSHLGTLVNSGGFTGEAPYGIESQALRGASYSTAQGDYIENQVWLDAGTYAFDFDGYTGGNHGILKLSIDGTPVGTPQPANTLRPPDYTANPNNGNNGGSALVTGEVDHYDANGQVGVPSALTGIVVASSGWHLVRQTVSGKNSAASAYNAIDIGWLRRAA
jgi:hypothetical protein